MGGETSTKDSQVLLELIVKRSSMKGQITKFKNYINVLITRETLTSIELAELTLKLGKFESLSNRYDDLQNQIDVLNPGNLENEVDEWSDIEQLFISNIASAQILIQKYNSSKHDETSYKDLNASHSSSAQCSADHSNIIGFKLPQLVIEKYDGSYFRWLDFRDTFSSLIHNNERIPRIHKFHYLISYLTGDAARIISNFEVSDSNYLEAWKMLCERYNNKRQLVNHHLNSLLNMQQANRETHGSLRFIVDHITKNLRALSSLGLPTDKWDVLIIHIMSSKLDAHTLLKWEECRGAKDDIPTLDAFYKFLIERADTLESISRNSAKPTSQSTARAASSANNNRFSTKSFTSSNEASKIACVVCNGEHRIYDCPSFIAKSIDERIAEAHRLKLCTNCLRVGHKVPACRLGPCSKCKGRHNSLIHKTSKANNNSSSSSSSVATIIPDNTDDTIANFAKQNSKQVLLSTALIEVANPRTNQTEMVRALLDCGSESSFMTQSLKDRLSLETKSNCHINVVGIGNHQTAQVKDTCVAQLKSLVTSFGVTSGFLVLAQLTGNVPKLSVDTQSLQIPSELKLADPMFHQVAPTEILIGCDLFWDIIGREQRTLGPNKPKLISSQFGWIISGPMNASLPNNKVQCNHSFILNSSSADYTSIDVHKELTRFWKLEEVPLKSNLSESERACEANFLSRTLRLDSGRFSVGLPLKDSPDCLGNSYTSAKKQLLSLEKRFRRQPIVKQQYVEFMQEYSDLGHLSESPIPIPETSYFLCHHAVFKASESSKIRVVFNGSLPSSSGYSVNDILLVGPNIQDSLFSILIRACQYKFLINGDVEKLYRQTLIHKEDRCLQLILWRENDSSPIKTLQLNTVTYGMASSSYLSTRCLWQLGEECPDPAIKEIIQHDFFADDLITGADDENTLLHIQQSVSAALQKGCLNLRKFKSNSSLVSKSVAATYSSEPLIVSESTSTLGMGWNPSNDQLHFPFKLPPLTNKNALTKRSILSSIFQIFDPLGLLSPCVIKAKMLLQRLWLLKLSWDDPIPDDIERDWNKFISSLPSLLCLEVPRRVLCDEPVSVSLHSFCDASQKGYGVCIYLRSVNSRNEVTVRLLCSKSKVAPIKATTIPRLELCAALLSAKLCKSVRESLRNNIQEEVHWCDSTIVLSWLHCSFQNLKTFVANRVLEISELTNSNSWRFVPTAFNSADLISRSLNPDQLSKSDLWWYGPSYLSGPEDTWPVLNDRLDITELPETKITITTNVMNNIEPILQFTNYSNLSRLKRLFAYLVRFLHNTRKPNSRREGSLSVDELNSSFLHLCRLSQQESFRTEYDMLARNKALSPKSQLLSLSPFLSNDKLIRVGGRLDAFDYSFDKKHPVLLSAKHHLTKLIFEYEHKHNLHAGPQLLLATIREYVWPVNGRLLARRTFHNCFKCRRLQEKTMQPKMGNLPAERITPSLPFQSVGLDLSGAFSILSRKGRGAKVEKAYLIIFVDLRYKCVHLEAISSLSKDAFVMTFRRFVARRGRPTEVFSDNGSNIVAGAKEISYFLKNNADVISDFASEEGIKFFFSPVFAPHFGGIFESAIKSAKFHIKRVMGNSHLTFEELSTLFAQVESVLNSRPLCPFSSSPDDFLCLSPGNFLIGRALNTLPSQKLEDCNPNHLRRYERVQQIYQHFWKRWHREYIAELQQRHKWKTNSSNPNVGDLVLIQEDNVPPRRWRLGRISKLFYGPKDQIARVADVTTPRGCIRRPLVRLCALPTAEDLES